jgi:hypothetical protein
MYFGRISRRLPHRWGVKLYPLFKFIICNGALQCSSVGLAPLHPIAAALICKHWNGYRVRVNFSGFWVSWRLYLYWLRL